MEKIYVIFAGTRYQFRGTLSDICEYVGVNINLVKQNMHEYGLSLEESINFEMIKNLKENHEKRNRKMVKNNIDYLNINYSNLCESLSEGKTLEEALECSNNNDDSCNQDDKEKEERKMREERIITQLNTDNDDFDNSEIYNKAITGKSMNYCGTLVNFMNNNREKYNNMSHVGDIVAYSIINSIVNDRYTKIINFIEDFLSLKDFNVLVNEKIHNNKLKYDKFEVSIARDLMCYFYKNYDIVTIDEFKNKFTINSDRLEDFKLSMFEMIVRKSYLSTK